MPLTINVPIGKKVLLHSGPKNVGGGAVTPPADLAFAQVGADIINLWGAPNFGDIFVAAKTTLGSTQVNISSASNPGKDVLVNVNVTPDDTFDHFEPSGDPPIAQ